MLNLLKQIKKSLSDQYDDSELDAVARLLMEEVTQLSFSHLIAHRPSLTDAQQQHLSSLLNLLAKGAPLQYALGYTLFCNLRIETDCRALIPRPETEELTEWICEENQKHSPAILDIGTGSGCIAIALAHFFPQSSVQAVDSSTEALALAKTNAAKNGVEAEFFHCDILSCTAADFPRKYDIIVSNPPYITLSEAPAMDARVTAYEPHSALFVPDSQPLLFYDAIVPLAATLLNENGKLYFETSHTRANQVADSLANKHFKEIIIRKDMSGKERMIRGIYK